MHFKKISFSEEEKSIQYVGNGGLILNSLFNKSSKRTGFLLTSLNFLMGNVVWVTLKYFF